MAQLPLKAFQNLTIDEIRHIVDVMRDADVEENEEPDSCSTIKRAPKSASEPSKKKEEERQPVIDDHDTDTNNNTLKRMSDPENNESNGIPSVPQVHMGAGFMKIFNQCPLEIYASYCWMNSDTKGMNLFDLNHF